MATKESGPVKLKIRNAMRSVYGTEDTSAASKRSTAGAKITASGAKIQTAKVGSTNGKVSKERNNVFSKFGDIVPYISNIANSFRRAPPPAVPGSISPVYTNRVNFDNQRVEADRMTRGVNANADRSLDENTAAAFKGSSLASNIRAKNAISESEFNTNAQLSSETARINAGIEAQNVQMMNQYRDNQVEAEVANQREQSANLSNAADKYVGQQQFRDAQELDMAKWKAYQPLFNTSGVAKRAYGEYSDGGNLLKPLPARQKVFTGGGGFNYTGAGASVGAGTGKGWRVPNAGYDWSNNGMGKKSPTWESATGRTAEDMKLRNMVNYFKNNNPSSNVYEQRPENMHYSITPSTPVVSDRPTFAAYGGKLRKRVF